MKRSFPQRDRVLERAGPRGAWWVWEKRAAWGKTRERSLMPALFGQHAALAYFPPGAVPGPFLFFLAFSGEPGTASRSRYCGLPLCVRQRVLPFPDLLVWPDEAWFG